MKIIIGIARFLVGALFIFSGLIKINDPVGTAIKLHEYFDVFAADGLGFFEWFIPYSLPLAVFLNVLEVALGVAVLVKFRMNVTLWILLGMIVFFTFLTFYSAQFNKVTDCGCFGDAIPLTPWESFGKDVILLFLILLLFWKRKKFEPAFRGPTPVILTGATTMVSLILAIYAIRHLPFMDFRAYKVGVSIPEAMQPSSNPVYEYVFEKNGEEVRSKEYLPAADGYIYQSYKELSPGEPPKITDYSLWNDEGEFTQESLTGNRLFMISYDLEKSDSEGIEAFNALVQELNGAQGVQPALLTSSPADRVDAYRHEYQLAFPYYFGDATVLKTIIRANPGIVLMQEGTVVAKWHHNDTPTANEVLNALN